MSWYCCCGEEDTPWCDDFNSKLYLTSGQFSTTLKTSEDVSSISASPTAISWTGTDTPWCYGGKFLLTSGQFTSTIKTSLASTFLGSDTHGVSWDGTNTPASTVNANLYLTSGQFTSTIKDSLDVFRPPADTASGISWQSDLSSTPWSDTSGVFGDDIDKLYLYSGQFTSTIKDSEDITSVDNLPTDISWDGENYVWSGNAGNKLFVQAASGGLFTSTLVTSVSCNDTVADIIGNPRGVNSNKATVG